MVQAGQGQLTIHEATLDGSVLEEPFLKEGRGSAFESRPGTLVVLRATERGLGLLRRKIEQLVGRGFHAIDVAFDGVGDKLRSPDEAWIGIRQGAQYAEQFAAWLVLSDARPAVQAALEKAAARDGSVRVELFADARAAGEALRRRELEANDGVEPLQVGSTDALSQGSDDTVDPNDWGWGSQDTTETVQPGAELPAVDVAEVLLQADELASLRERASQLVKRGKKYLTLRMHFKRDRRMSESDMAALVAARDQLAAAGGQLVLASLQEEVLKWLKLLDEDRHFVVADSADAADLAHRRHAAGLVTKAPAAADAPAFVVASSDAKRIVVRPSAKAKGGKAVAAALRVVNLGKDGLAHLGARLERIARDGVRDIAVDLARFKDVRGERFDAVPSAVEKARARGARVAFASASRDVKALLKLLGLDPAMAGETLDAAALALAAAHAPFEELRFDVTREDLLGAPPVDPVSSVDLEDELEVPADQAAPGPASAALLAEVDALKAQLAAARAESKRAEGELADARRAADAATKAGAEAKRLEAELAAAKRQLEEQRKQAAEAKRLAEEQKKQADGERTRVTELELLATQDGRDREELEARLAAAGEAEARLADLEARLKDREARASSLEKALEALQDRAQELEAAAYKLPQLEKQLEARDAALAEQKVALATSQASITRELEEHQRVVSRLERDLRDAREVAGKQGQAAESAQSDRVRELEDALAAAESKTRAAEARASAAEQKASAAEQKASAAEQRGAAGKSAEQSAAESRASQAEQKASAAEQRASAAEAEAKRAAERAASLEKELAKARSAPALPAAPAPLPSLPGSAGDLQRRVAELERKNAQILTEAEEEIARLTREQAQLREELESAGDMIERLGKELEFS